MHGFIVNLYVIILCTKGEKQAIQNMPKDNVFIVSIDPAHSLDDVLDVKLFGEPLVLDEPLTGRRLTIVEVDADQVLDDFRSLLEAFDVQKLADALQLEAVASCTNRGGFCEINSSTTIAFNFFLERIQPL